MMYHYSVEREILFTDKGQRLFLGIKKQVDKMLAISGAFRMGYAAVLPEGIGAADSWQMMACVDRLVELGEIREIEQGRCAGQDRVFVKAGE